MPELIPLSFGVGGGGGGPVTSTSITDASDSGKAVLTGDPASGRAALGAGTSNLALGTSSTTAKPGNWKPSVDDLTDADPLGKQVLKATSQSALRSAIGAGTSSLALGTTSLTAKAGDYQPTAENISNAGAVGRDVLKAASQAAGRTAIGAAAASDLASRPTSTNVKTFAYGTALPSTGAEGDVFFLVAP